MFLCLNFTPPKTEVNQTSETSFVCRITEILKILELKKKTSKYLQADKVSQVGLQVLVRTNIVRDGGGGAAIFPSVV